MGEAALRTPAAARIAAIGATIGRRQQQQDCANQATITLEDGREALLIVVADGMGGAVGGQIASLRAADAFAALCIASAAPLEERLQNALMAANAAIKSAVTASPRLQGMGSTLIGAVVDGARVSWISVGDSLVLSVEGGEVKRLNEDHSMGGVVDAMAARGEITWEEAAANDQRHLLRSALIGEPIPLIDQGSATLPLGSRLVVATDGILSLGFPEIARLVSSAEDDEAAVGAAVDRIDALGYDDQDNMTIAVVGLGADGARAGAWQGAAADGARGGTALAWAALAVGVVFMVGAGTAAWTMMQEEGGAASPPVVSRPIAQPISPSPASPQTTSPQPTSPSPAMPSPAPSRPPVAKPDRDDVPAISIRRPPPRKAPSGGEPPEKPRSVPAALDRGPTASPAPVASATASPAPFIKPEPIEGPVPGADGAGAQPPD